MSARGRLLTGVAGLQVSDEPFVPAADTYVTLGIDPVPGRVTLARKIGRGVGYAGRQDNYLSKHIMGGL